MARRSFGALALVAVSIGTAIAATPTAVQPTQLGASSVSEGDIGALPSIDQIVAIQSQITADGAAADPTGVAGAGGGTIAYHAGGKTASGKGSARLYRTGFLGLEPTFGIDSRGTLFANAAQAGATFGGLVIRSRDGGASWQDVSSRAVAGVNTHSYTEDPYLYVDPSTDRVFWNDLQEPCQLISTSDNEGISWTDNLTACDQSDHQSMAAGPAPTGGAQPVGYPNVVYDCAINAGVAVPASNATTCDKSLDGGATFVFTGAPAFVGGPPSGNNSSIPGTCDGAAAHAFVGPDGTLYLPRGWCGQPYLAISHDEGASWTRVQVADNGMNLGVDPIGDIPASDHEAGVVADSLGNVYYAWVAYDRQPYLAISHDGGATWGKPITIGPPGLRQAVLPSLALGSPGKLAFAYMGSTNAPAGPPFPTDDDAYANATWNGYLTETTNALAASPTFQTVSVNNPRDPLIRGTCGPIRCQAVYDFIDVQIAPDGTPWGIFIDACLTNSPCTSLGEDVVAKIAGGPSLR